MMNRREMLAGVGEVAAAAALNKLGADKMPNAKRANASGITPTRAAPNFREKRISASRPAIRTSTAHTPTRCQSSRRKAARKAAEGRSALVMPAAGRGGCGAGAARRAPLDPKALFAKLINAKPSEISYIPNTSTGENLVVNGLGRGRTFGWQRRHRHAAL